MYVEYPTPNILREGLELAKLDHNLSITGVLGTLRQIGRKAKCGSSIKSDQESTLSYAKGMTKIHVINPLLIDPAVPGNGGLRHVRTI